MSKIFFVPLVILFLCGCATVYNPATERKEYIFINDATEVAIGKSVAGEISRKKELLQDATAQARVQRVGAKIAAVSDRTNIVYEFYILNDRELNALSLPGGIIYINKGLLDKLNDDELAFILGHEVGHVAAKHAVKSMQSNMAFQMLLTLAFAATGDTGAKTTTNIAQATDQVYNLIALGYSRKDEYFADRLGVRYAFNAGFDPYAAISSLEKIKKTEGANLKVLEYLRTHPYVDERIKALKDLIPQLTSQ